MKFSSWTFEVIPNQPLNISDIVKEDEVAMAATINLDELDAELAQYHQEAADFCCKSNLSLVWCGGQDIDTGKRDLHAISYNSNLSTSTPVSTLKKLEITSLDHCIEIAATRDLHSIAEIVRGHNQPVLKKAKIDHLCPIVLARFNTTLNQPVTLKCLLDTGA